MKITIEKGCKVQFTDKPVVNVFNEPKKLTKSEAERVADLNMVWEYLYRHKVYGLCDIVSREIGIIKGTIV